MPYGEIKEFENNFGNIDSLRKKLKDAHKDLSDLEVKF